MDDPNALGPALPPEQQPGQQPGQPAPSTQGDHFRREPPDNIPESRRRLVSRWVSRVQRARTHYRRDLERMRDATEFVLGAQWTNGRPLVGDQAKDDRYVANIALRHVQQSVANLYPQNPTVKFVKRAKLM